jgi:hypothetical protein
METAGMLAVAIAFLVALAGSGVGVAFLVGRRGARPATKGTARQDERLPESFVRELERCLELGDCVTRDCDNLAAVVASHSPPVSRGVTSAVNQLVKTTKSLAGRLHRMGVDASIVRSKPEGPHPAIPFYPGEPVPPRPPAAAPSAVLAQEEVDSAPQTDKSVKLPPSPFADARNFPRSSFRGSAKATIYPRHPGPGREPVQCTVLTRDLSCGGIGIAHSEQLFPKQIVVIDAVGKLLVGEVRWCRRVDEHFYVAGCRLVKTNH